MSSQHTVIVGGSSGIGLATARHLLASGARVTITGRSEIGLVEARRQLGPEAQVVPMDASAADALPAHSRKSASSITWCWRSAAAREWALSPP